MSRAYDNAADARNQQGGRRNLIINGAMQVAQRGTSFVSPSGNTITLDRYAVWVSNSGGDGTVTQSTDAPSYFKNSLKIEVTSASGGLAAGDYTLIRHKIEGQNCIPQLAWGTANAKSVTLSFWVKSNLTGTFGGAFSNDDFNRGYPFTYTIDSANTWEYKTITVTGDTTGTWKSDTNAGIWIQFDQGVGTTYAHTPGSWQAISALGASGGTDLYATVGNTWQITGVQLEVGTVATPFEHRSYGEEYLACARYYYQVTGEGSGGFLSVGPAQRWSNATEGVCQTLLPVPLRTKPTISIGTNVFADYGGTSTALTGTSTIWAAANNATSVWWKYTHSSSSVGAGTGGLIYTNDASASFVKFDAEL